MNSNKIQHFTDLFAWQKGHLLVLEIYRITKNFPKDEMFGLTSQIRRAACSITGNIAEGYGRYGFKDKMKFYTIAKGSLAEVQNYLIIARDLNFISKEEYNSIKILSVEDFKLICGLINSTEIMI